MTVPADHATHGADTTVCVVVAGMGPETCQGSPRSHPSAPTHHRAFQRAVMRLTRSVPETGWQAHRLRRPASGAGGIEVAARRRCFRAKLRVHPEDNVCEKRVLFTPQFFDPVELQVLAAAIRDGFTFVDLGANVGVYSLFVAGLAGRKARILAVEPQPEIYRRLAFNVAANDLGTSGPCNARSPTVTVRWTCSSIGATGAEQHRHGRRGRRSASHAGLWKVC